MSAWGITWRIVSAIAWLPIAWEFWAAYRDQVPLSGFYTVAAIWGCVAVIISFLDDIFGEATTR